MVQGVRGLAQSFTTEVQVQQLCLFEDAVLEGGHGGKSGAVESLWRTWLHAALLVC